MSSVLETLGNLGDFVGGIAVVFSLVYLAVQIRQNTNAVRASSWQSVVAGARSVNQGKADPQVQRSLAIGLRSDVFPTFEDQARFNVVMSDEALQFQSILALYLSGQLDEATYRPYLRWFASFAASPGGRAWWDRYRDNLS